MSRSGSDTAASGGEDSTPIDAIDDVAPVVEHSHRNIAGGAHRAAVFGVSDGLVSNVSLIVGIAGADSAQGPVRLAGLAGLVAGAVSMAAGEYVSMRAQAELLERELELERRELARNPNVEQVELALLYQSRGMSPDQAMAMSAQIMKDPERALEVHAREELGVDPNELGNPWLASASSFVAFAGGAILPLIPWFFTGGTSAIIMSIVLAVIGAAVVGAVLGYLTDRPRWWSASRQVLIAVVAAAVTYGVGSAVGVGLD